MATSDKQPIGSYANMRDLSQIEIDLVEVDMLYSTIDGFADQKRAVHEAFQTWKGTNK